MSKIPPVLFIIVVTVSAVVVSAAAVALLRQPLARRRGARPSRHIDPKGRSVRPPRLTPYVASPWPEYRHSGHHFHREPAMRHSYTTWHAFARLLDDIALISRMLRASPPTWSNYQPGPRVRPQLVNANHCGQLPTVCKRERIQAQGSGIGLPTDDNCHACTLPADHERSMGSQARGLAVGAYPGSHRCEYEAFGP